MNTNKVQGFTLIELGIVFAAMAILASIVLAGPGFSQAAAQGKAIEGVYTTKLAVQNQLALWGSTIPDHMSGTDNADAVVALLVAKNLVRVNDDNHIELSAGFRIKAIQLGGQAQLGFHLVAPTQAAAQDVQDILSQDPNYFIHSSPASVCDGLANEDSTTFICFDNLL